MTLYTKMPELQYKKLHSLISYWNRWILNAFLAYFSKKLLDWKTASEIGLSWKVNIKCYSGQDTYRFIINWSQDSTPWVGQGANILEYSPEINVTQMLWNCICQEENCHFNVPPFGLLVTISLSIRVCVCVCERDQSLAGSR
jgi:hypothetical protein